VQVVCLSFHFKVATVCAPQVVVHNLPWNCTWQQLKDAFTQGNLPNIERADVIVDSSGRSRCIAPSPVACARCLCYAWILSFLALSCLWDGSLLGLLRVAVDGAAAKRASGGGYVAPEARRWMLRCCFDGLVECTGVSAQSASRLRRTHSMQQMS
jgi:RNA recognition motif. (a.k.a. RRM, RBD, or RNP domain)